MEEIPYINWPKAVLFTLSETDLGLIFIENQVSLGSNNTVMGK